MKSPIQQLTNREKEVLDVLWDSGKPLTSSEIVSLSVNKSWKPSYVHLLINSLLNKEMIRVAGFRQTTKNFARTFEPVISREEYTALFLKKQNGNSTSLPTLFAALIEEETDRKLIEELAKMIEERKKELSQDLEKDSKSHDNK